METINRRDFLKGSVGAATAFTVLPSGGTSAAQNKVVLGIMGVGGRGRALLTSLVKRSDIKIKYICDADTRRYGPAADGRCSKGMPVFARARLLSRSLPS